MAVTLVTYDLRKPDRNYDEVHEYLKQYEHCKGMDSVWLLDTPVTCSKIRDDLKTVTDKDDTIFVVRLKRNWASHNYRCKLWLKDPDRSW